VVDGVGVDGHPRPRCGGHCRQGATVIGQEGSGTGEGGEIGEENHEQADSVNQFFPYTVDIEFAPIWLPLGVRPSNSKAASRMRRSLASPPTP